MTRPTERAWGWVAHLRDGGTTPWSQWHGSAPASAPVLPGAQQLELLRRLNLHRGDRDDLSARLVDRVMGAAAAGRGNADLPLVGVGDPTYGPRPVDPATVGPHDLVRVASVLLAEDLVAVGRPATRTRCARPWRRHYRLLGDPLVVSQTVEELSLRGHPPGGSHPLVVVVGGPFDQLLVHTWTRRCFEHGTRPWPEWLRFWRERDQLPPRLELAEVVARWSPRPPLVRVVTDAAHLARQLGVHRLSPVRVPSADQAELARRIAAVVGLLAPAHDRPELMTRILWARMPATATPPVAVPVHDRDWLESGAARVSLELRRAGYPVVGDLADLAPRFDVTSRAGVSGAALDELVLALAVRMLVDPDWCRSEGQASR